MKKLENNIALISGSGCTFWGGANCGALVAAAAFNGWNPAGWIAGVAAGAACGELINSCWNSN